MSTLEWDDTEGFECLGCSNWVICSRLSPFCSEIFQTFSPSYWGGQFLLPQRANNGKRDDLSAPEVNKTVIPYLPNSNSFFLALNSRNLAVVNLHTADSISEDDEGGAASAPKKEPALSSAAVVAAAICFCLCGREEDVFCSAR